MQTCYLYVTGEAISNNSVRELFGIDENDKYKASRIIKDTLEAKFIKPVDENTAPRYMKYIPSFLFGKKKEVNMRINDFYNILELVKLDVLYKKRKA